MGDVIYRLLSYVNSVKEKDIYYNIAWKIIHDIKRIPDITINQLADSCFVSPPTISRFCRKMGYKSFGELKDSAKQMLSYYANSINFSSEEKEGIGKEPREIIKKVYPLMISTLEATEKSIDMDTIDKVVEAIHNSNKVAFFGLHFSQLVALDAQTKFISLGKFCTAFLDVPDQLEYATELDEGSLAIFFSVSAKIQYFGNIINKLKERRVKIVVVTQNSQGILAQKADYVICANGSESDFSSLSISGRIALLSIVDVLYVRYAYLYAKKNK